MRAESCLGGLLGWVAHSVVDYVIYNPITKKPVVTLVRISILTTTLSSKATRSLE